MTFGQINSEKILHGKISVASGSVEGVTIVNLVNEKSAISDNNGEFFILAKADDLLVFSSVNKHPEINAVSLGISPRGIKKYTPAERRLKTAGDFKPIQLLGILGGSLPVDPIINAISGRTAMLKKELEVETKERLLALFDALYKDDNYFIKTLKIPEDYIKGFKYYCIENQNFAEVLKTKSKTQIEFLIVPLASKYNEIIFDEKQKLGTN